MSKELTIWLLIFAVGAITYTARISFIALFARRDMPPLLAEALKHVPVAMLTAIVVPAVVFMPADVLRLDPGNPKLIAALVAGAVAWWTKSAVTTIVAGMSALWALRYFLT
jgi:branched-subunit amino acid transport protein